MEIQKGMYGLPQAEKIANDKVELRLAKFISPITPGMWRHRTPPLKFSLVLDDFGVKYELQEDSTHLLDTLTTIYKISEEWDGNLFCGINWKWDYYKS